MQQSDSDFVENLYVQYVDVLRIACRSRFGGSMEYHEVVEDSINDTFVLCLQCCDFLRSHPNPIGWLQITCQNKFRENRNKLIRRKQKIVLMGDKVNTGSVIRDPADIFERKESIREQMRCLGSDERQVLVDYHYYGLKIREIALNRGMSESMVKKHLYSATIILGTYEKDGCINPPT